MSEIKSIPKPPLKWLLVAREAGIPDASDSADRCSVDHLLLDQFSRATFVEVKRSKNTQIRREIVGQILDYAANAIVYRPADKLRLLAAERFESSEHLSEHIYTYFELGDSPTHDQAAVEQHWQTVDPDLLEGNVRLLFVADQIPRELRRIIEFLNDKMSTVEVLGVEIRQYRGEGISALVQRIVGQTESARDTKSGSTVSSTRRITKEDLLRAYTGKTGTFWTDLITKAERDPQ